MNVENAFGILSSRFRIFKKYLNYAPERVDLFVLTACGLHNVLLKDLYMKNTELEIMTEMRDAPNASSNNAMIIIN